MQEYNNNLTRSYVYIRIRRKHISMDCQYRQLVLSIRFIGNNFDMIPAVLFN